MMARRSLFTTYWFGEALVLAICLAVVVSAMILTPGPDYVSFLGIDIPVSCGFRRATGYNCPGCGLTRSFTFMAHLSPIEALKMNLIGPPLFLMVASQVPWRIWRLWRGPTGAMKKYEESLSQG
jgi:hypothetical protein